MSKTMRLVLNEGKKEEQFYKKLKRDYIDKDKKATDKAVDEALKKDEEMENKKIKEIILTAKSKYEIEEEVIEEIFKMLYQQKELVPNNLEYVINICNISNIRNIGKYKKGEKAIKDLLKIHFPYTLI